MTIAICMYIAMVVIATMLLLQAVYMAGKKRGQDEVLEAYLGAKLEIYILEKKVQELDGAGETCRAKATEVRS